MSLADISRRVPARRVSAVALTLASVVGASAFILHNAQQGLARDDVGEDVRWQLPPPPAYLRAQVAAAEAAQASVLPTPPTAPQDATELNVAALPPEVPPTTGMSPMPETVPPPLSQASSAPQAAPVQATTSQQTLKKQSKPQKQVAPKAEKPAGQKQAAKHKNEVPKQTKAKEVKPHYAKVQELPPAPAIDPQPAPPPVQPTNRIPIISSVVDGVTAVGTSLSNLVR